MRRMMYTIGIVVVVIYLMLDITVSKGVGTYPSLQDLSSSSNSKVDKIVMHKLNNSEWVKVIVMLDTDSIGGVKSNLNSLGYPEKRSIFLEHESTVISTLSSNEFKVRYKYGIIHGFSGEVNKEGLIKLINNPGVDYIYAVRKIRLNLDESIPLIEANYSWGLNFTGLGQTICVLDSGANYSSGSPLYGKVVDGYDYVNLDYFPYDDNGHGTHVASIAAGNGTVVGVAPDATLIVHKVTDENGDGDDQDVIWAIENCVGKIGTYNISSMILSFSLEGGAYNSTTCNQTEPLNSAVNEAHDEGILMAVASGNDARTDGINAPACALGATSVGAVYDADVGSKEYCIEPWYWQWWCWLFGPSCEDSTTEADKITCFTNRNVDLDLLAPGSEINASRWCQGSCLEGCYCSGNHMACGGTSMAAPHVGGAAAVLKQMSNNLNPELMEYVLKETGKAVYDNGTQETFPRINLHNATLMVLRSVFFTVSNNGSASLNVSAINSSASWVSSIYPSSFVLPVGFNKTVMVTVDIGDVMPVGSYNTDLLVYSNDPDESVKHVPLLYQRVKPGCTGVCPPASGDWNVTSYTSIWSNNTVVNGRVNILNSSTLFLGELEVNVSNGLRWYDGTIRLDDVKFRFV